MKHPLDDIVFLTEQGFSPIPPEDQLWLESQGLATRQDWIVSKLRDEVERYGFELIPDSNYGDSTWRIPRTNRRVTVEEDGTMMWIELPFGSE